MRRAEKLALILVVGAVLSQLAFAAIWYESYGKAKKALDEKQWAEAVRLLNEAIAIKSDSNARARTYGVNFDPYFPYLKLGVAYFNMGQFQAAEQQLDKEEQLREIAKSAVDYAQLKDIREKIKQALEGQAAADHARIRGLVSASLEDAGRAEAAGKWDEAIAAANKALALAPNDQAVNDVVSRIQSKITEAEKRREQESRAAALVEEGKTYLNDGQLQPAAGKFTEALAIVDSAEIRSLLDDTQSKLRVQVADKEPELRAQRIADILRIARSLQAEGKSNEALVKLQEAVVLDPTNVEVKTLQQTLVAARAKIAEARSANENVRALLDEAQRQFNAGDFEAALASANSVRTSEPGNRAAIDLATKANDALKARSSGRESESFKLKPVIIPVDRRDSEIDQGLFVETAHRASFALRGSVNHRSAVAMKVQLRHLSSMMSVVDYIADPQRADLAIDRLEDLKPEIRVERQTNPVITYYTARCLLRPGFSEFLVSATDSTDPESVQSSRYLVLYSLPFYTKLWFKLVLAGVVVASAGTLYGLRHRNRSIRTKRRFNPYVAGAPVLQDALFFGREALLKRVLQSVHNNSIMLYGERRIGKTSFQHYLKKRLARLDDPEYVFYPVYIDLQGVPQERFFSTLRDEIFRELAPVLDGALPTPDPADGSAYDYRELVEDIRKVLRILGARSAKKVKLVLQMDEVDQLNSYDPRVNQRLRSLFMRNFAENLAAVVSGVAIQKRWEGEGSPWYNFFEEIEIGPIRPEDAERLIEEPIRGKFKLEKGVTERILSITGYRPYLVQKMCIALINRMHDEGRRTVTMEDVERVGRPAEA